jgi:hypothetical protein
LHIGANEAGGRCCFESVGKQLQPSVPQVPRVALALRGTAQYAQETRRSRLFQNEPLDQLERRTRIIGAQRGHVVDVLQTLFTATSAPSLASSSVTAATIAWRLRSACFFGVRAADSACITSIDHGRDGKSTPRK